MTSWLLIIVFAGHMDVADTMTYPDCMAAAKAITEAGQTAFCEFHPIEGTTMEMRRALAEIEEGETRLTN